MKYILLYKKVSRSEALKRAIYIYGLTVLGLEDMSNHELKNRIQQRSDSAFKKALMKNKVLATYLCFERYEYIAYKNDIYKLIWWSGTDFRFQSLYRRNLDMSSALQTIIRSKFDAQGSMKNYHAIVLHEQKNL